MNRILLGIAAIGIGFVLCVIARAVAIRSQIVDQPESDRAHTIVTPLLGGVAVAVSTISVYLLLHREGLSSLREPFVRGYLCSAVLVGLVGLLDDIKGLNPIQKLAGQIAAGALFLLLAGIDVASASGIFLAILFGVWIVFCANSLNLVDNLDGLAGGSSAVSAIALAIVAEHMGKTHVSVLLFGLSGSTVGFLILNFPPARLFLGDAGSLFLGLSLGVCSVSLFSGNGELFFPCVLCLAYPIFDTFFVTARRFLAGRRFYVGGTDHSSHLLLRVLGHKWMVTLLVILASAVSSLAGVLAVHLQLLWQALLTAVFFFIYSVFGIMLTRAAKGKR
jgi:UDP-GlcNAc:undecaprenyl-phosphate GlcNAc-1-phosphate transferase